MKLVFMGTPDFSVPALRALVAGGHDILAVYSQPPRPAGRGKKLRPSAVHLAAEAMGIPVRHPENFKSPETVAEFAALGADAAVVVAYGLILPQSVLDAPKWGCLNIHASLLPRWRGAAPIHRAIMAGDDRTGICIMQMEAGLDTGPVIHRSTTEIGENDTTGALHDRLADMGGDAIARVLSQPGPWSSEPQAAEGVTYAAKIDKAEAQIDWTAPGQQVDRQVRGLSPFPGAWFLNGDERVKVLTSTYRAAVSGRPGQVIGDGIVACGTGGVELQILQRAGKKPMPLAEFLRGGALRPETSPV